MVATQVSGGGEVASVAGLDRAGGQRDRQMTLATAGLAEQQDWAALGHKA